MLFPTKAQLAKEKADECPENEVRKAEEEYRRHLELEDVDGDGVITRADIIAAEAGK